MESCILPLVYITSFALRGSELMSSGLGMITCIMFVHYTAKVLGQISPRAFKYPANDSPPSVPFSSLPLLGERIEVRG
jgi:hypothetical protein